MHYSFKAEGLHSIEKETPVNLQNALKNSLYNFFIMPVIKHYHVVTIGNTWNVVVKYRRLQHYTLMQRAYNNFIFFLPHALGASDLDNKI